MYYDKIVLLKVVVSYLHIMIFHIFNLPIFIFVVMTFVVWQICIMTFLLFNIFVVYEISCYENSLWQIIYVIFVYDKFPVLKIHYDILSSTGGKVNVIHTVLELVFGNIGYYSCKWSNCDGFDKYA